MATSLPFSQAPQSIRPGACANFGGEPLFLAGGCTHTYINMITITEVLCTTYLMNKFTYGIPKLCFERAILSVGMSWLGCRHCLDELDRGGGC